MPPGASLLCANHESWADPFVLMAALPGRPRLYWFGPKESDMSRGARNRLIVWTGSAVPYKPAKTDLREATRRVGAVFDAGGRLLIFGEGRIHALEGELLPLAEGAVFFAMRSGVTSSHSRCPSVTASDTTASSRACSASLTYTRVPWRRSSSSPAWRSK